MTEVLLLDSPTQWFSPDFLCTAAGFTIDWSSAFCPLVNGKLDTCTDKEAFARHPSSEEGYSGIMCLTGAKITMDIKDYRRIWVLTGTNINGYYEAKWPD
jgi:hypothetical protein